MLFDNCQIFETDKGGYWTVVSGYDKTLMTVDAPGHQLGEMAFGRGYRDVFHEWYLRWLFVGYNDLYDYVLCCFIVLSSEIIQRSGRGRRLFFGTCGMFLQFVKHEVFNQTLREWEFPADQQVG